MAAAFSDAFEPSAFQTGEEATSAVQPTGGWDIPRRTKEDIREERERLGIIPKRKVERAARSIAKRTKPGQSPEQIAQEIGRAKEFDKLIADITARNNAVIEGLALMVMQAIQARVLEELRDEDDAIAMLLLEM